MCDYKRVKEEQNWPTQRIVIPQKSLGQKPSRVAPRLEESTVELKTILIAMWVQKLQVKCNM